jgi:hypothetical protein
MIKKAKASKNLAKDVERKTVPQPKSKSVNIPDSAKVEITRMTQNLDNYLNGVIVGLGIKGKWSFNPQTMQLLVEDK